MKMLFTVLFCTILLSCASQKVNDEFRCPKNSTKRFTQISEVSHQMVQEGKTHAYNEVRFDCVSTPFMTHKVMFDRFGKWDKEIYLHNVPHPMLVWNEVALFANGKKYKVITNGLEDFNYVSATVMAFDMKDNDMLSDKVYERKGIISFFTTLILEEDFQKRDFYEAYWKKIDPSRWEIIKSRTN